jgi:integrase
MSNKAELIFDLKKEFINVPDRAVFLDLCEKSTQYVLEHGMMLWQVYHDPKNRKTPYALHFAKIKPSRLKEIRRIVKRKNIVGDILERQCMREIRKELKNHEWNLKEDWFETADVVPYEYSQKGPGLLRSSLITSLLRNGAPIQYVAQQVGHRSLATTASYAPPLTHAQLKKIHSKAHPRA